MAEGTKEIHLEEHIVKYLTKMIQPDFWEYTQKDTSCYDKELCIIPEDLIDFLTDTQEDKIVELYKQYASDTYQKMIEHVANEIKKRKTLDVFREGVKDRGQKLNLVYFKPNHSKSPEHATWYRKNRLTIIRQLKYSKKNENSIDIVLFVNGIPVVTMELKNALTGQYLHHAIKQYIEDRDPKEPLLEFKRCLVHFAVSTEQISMCTELKGKTTYFLPFNKALVNHDDNDYAVSYLWKDVLRRDSLLDLIQNYINLQINKEKYFDKQTKTLNEKQK